MDGYITKIYDNGNRINTSRYLTDELSINAVKGFEYGSGFEGAKMNGSEHNDVFENSAGNVETKTNYSGGIQGGLDTPFLGPIDNLTP